MIRGFVRAGGRSANVRVYDLTSSGGGRTIPTWLRNRVLAAYPDVQFADHASNKGGAFSASTHVTWSGGYSTKPAVTRIHDLPRQVHYLVNVPIVKRHIGAGATLGYKNHFGTIENCANLHNYVYNDVTSASRPHRGRPALRAAVQELRPDIDRAGRSGSSGSTTSPEPARCAARRGATSPTPS